MTTVDRYAPVLRGHHLFAGLSPQQLQRVLSTSHIDAYESGQLLFDRGQPARHFYIVLEGQVNLVLYSKAGEEKIVDILGPGNSFAEALLFREDPVYPVSAVAAARSQVARFHNGEYVAMLRSSPGSRPRLRDRRNSLSSSPGRNSPRACR
jgi:CRP-like cAMP-binding protein